MTASPRGMCESSYKNRSERMVLASELQEIAAGMKVVVGVLK